MSTGVTSEQQSACKELHQKLKTMNEAETLLPTTSKKFIKVLYSSLKRDKHVMGHGVQNKQQTVQ